MYSNNQGQVEVNPPPKRIVRFDSGYVKTLPGILKLVQLLCNFVGFICMKFSTAVVSAIFYNLVYWIGNAVTGVLLIFYIFHFVEKFDRIPWLKLEFFYCAVMCLGYLVTTILAALLGDSAGYACTFFAICALFTYGLDAYNKYKGWKRGLPAQ